MMNTMKKMFAFPLIPAALATLFLAALTGIAAAGWLGKGDQILFSMIQSGLAWCL